ncbi:MAG: DNA replication/repair protein RecF [Anaerolineales bacterium]|nr:DNA replication/repair protein RecF [Anaerolineales bacterium]
MYLTHLSLSNFRNYIRLDTSMPQGTLVVMGDNAQGKTSLLEAIYYLATFTSFQAGQNRELINFLAPKGDLVVGRIVAEYRRGQKNHRLEVRIIQESQGFNGVRVRREALLDGTKKKISELVGHFNAVLFLPRMMSIIDGTPTERRRYLDLAISQTNAHYTASLSAYNKALSQRNALLKTLSERGGDPEQLAYWDEQIIQTGAFLIRARIQAITEIEEQAALIHSELTRGAERLRLSYLPAYDPHHEPANQMVLNFDTPIDRNQFTREEIATGFEAALKTARRAEIARGQTTLGPHRDDVQFLANGVDLGVYGSRGQIRTALLSLKIAEINWMKSKTGYWPVLLLDEVLAELDTQRRADLIAHLTDIKQALLTTTDVDLFGSDFLENATVWQVENGRRIDS